MSEVPPVPDPSQQPPVQFAEYPRGGYGTSDKLLALYEGYSGLNYVFALNVVLATCGRFIGFAPLWNDSPPELLFVFYGIYLVIMLAAVGACSYIYNRKIALGKDWTPGQAILASVLTALFSWLCCGIFGYIVMQQIASNEMKKYGVRSGIGMKKKHVMERIEQIKASEAQAKSSGFQM